MIASQPTIETTDTRLAAILNEISSLEATCKSQKSLQDTSELKQRLLFLKWKRESLTVVYDWQNQESY